MRRLALASCLTLGLAAGLTLAPAARAQDRKPADIVKAIEDVKLPDLSKVNRSNQAEVLKYITDRQQAMTKKAELIGELYKADPKNEKLAKLLPERWTALLGQGVQGVKDLKTELDEVAKNAPSAELKTEAAFMKARAVMMTSRNDMEAATKAAEEFIAAAPKDERGAMLLYSIAMSGGDEAKQTELYKRIGKEYPTSRVAKAVAGSLKQMDAVGKPFDIEFTDAIKGSTVSMKTLKGKVVVVDFWATWCGPCVAEMPKMKNLYAEYKDKGVEFIGVSLDAPKEEGGLDKLKEFVAKNEIGWPQYYQGNGWQSEFSSSWGINAIPCVFIVDTQGKLHSVKARGKLEALIPELLKKGKTDAGAGAGAGGN